MPCHFHIPVYTFPYSMYHHDSSAKKSFLNVYTNNAIFIAFYYLLFHNFLYTPVLQDHLAVTFPDTFWPHLK